MLMPKIPAQEILRVLAAVPEDGWISTYEVEAAVKRAGHTMSGKVITRLKALEQQGLLIHRAKRMGCTTVWIWKRK